MIDTSTALFCVIGSPIAHSLSPVMHNQALADTGFNAVYLAFHVSDIESAIAGIRGMGIRGASITIPHKTPVMNHLDHIDNTARRIGAVNTIVNHNGVLTGYNTDCQGAVNALRHKTTVQDKDITILGAGGAARAAAYGMKKAGGKVTILNRSVDKGQRLADDLGVDFNPLEQTCALKGQILINTTSVGMTPQHDVMPISPKQLNPDMLVMDIIYNPLKTKLLQSAETMGCAIIDGIDMFVYQGALQFEMWTDLPAPIEIMRQSVVKALSQQSNDYQYARNQQL